MATSTEQQMNALLDYYAGENGGGKNAASTAGNLSGFNTASAAPNAMAISQALGISPTAGQAALTGISNLLGPAGFGLGALNTLGNAVNTNANTNMLAGLGTTPSGLQTIGGYFGGNPLAGNYTGALNMAMADKMPGFQGIEIAQAPGDFGPGFNAPGNTLSGAALGDYNAGYGKDAVQGAPMGGVGQPDNNQGMGESDQSPGGSSGNGGQEMANSGEPGAGTSGEGFARGGLVEGNRLSQGAVKAGLMHGAAPGQADTRAVTVARGSYVAPAGAVAALGQGNTMAGAKALERGEKAPSGQPVQADVSDGEFIIDPARVLAIGDGDMKRGAARLDHLFGLIRQHGVDGMIPEGRPFVLESLFVRKSA